METKNEEKTLKTKTDMFRKNGNGGTEVFMKE